MPNAWDAGSARLLESLGFPALGTTSAGVAYCRGLPDYQDRISRDEMLTAYGAAAQAVNIPVSGDLEAGYGDTPEAVAETITLSIAQGMVGGSIEDHLYGPAGPLYDIEEAVARIEAARAAADSSGLNYTLTARAECYLVDHEDAFAESLRRCNRYREAGADCLYVPGVREPETIAALVREIDGPLNVVMGLVGAGLTVAQLSDLGVRRISVGGSLARRAFAALRDAALEIRQEGSFGYAKAAIPDAELSGFFEARMERDR